MIKNLVKGLLVGVGIRLLGDYRHLSLQLLRIEAAACYLRGVQMARVSAVGLMRMGLMIGLICVGTLLLHVCLFILLPWSANVKAAGGLLLGLVYVIIGVATLRASMAEKVWMEKSGAAKMLEETIVGLKQR
jgi:hypothetical protein